jgi:branched-chain amino acid transport system permease protein
MSGTMALSVFFVGLAVGGVYTAMALGLTLVYGITRVFNFAQGSFFLWGALIAWTLLEYTPLPYGLVFVLTIGIAFLFGMGYEKIIIKPLRRFPDWTLTAIIVTLGSALLLDSLVLVVFGARGRTLPNLVDGVLSVGSISITRQDVVILVIAVTIVVCLTQFLRRTTTGKAMRAVPQDGMGAAIVGIPTDKVFNLVFGITAALGAIAGMLLAPRTQIYFETGWGILIKSFVVVIFGGLGSIKGTLVAAFALALIEAYITALLGGLWALPIFLGLLLVVLAVRPRGLFGTW